MTTNNYQQLAARTLNTVAPELSDEEKMLLWCAIGVAGEAGEVSELAKKQIFHKHGIDRDKWIKELGDVLWYIAGCCTVLQVDLNDVMQANIDKLKERYPDGFDTERSKLHVAK